MEILETRVVPAQLIWTNGTSNGLWNTAANWIDPLGGPSVVPGSGDYVIFQAASGGNPGSTSGCTLDVTTAAVDRVLMDGSYTGVFAIPASSGLSTTNHIIQNGGLTLAGGSSLFAGTYLDVNGTVTTVGFGTTPATFGANGDLFLYYTGVITAAGMSNPLAISSTGFDDAGTLILGFTGMAGAMSITGTYVQSSAGSIAITNGSTLTFLTGGTDFPIIQGTINLVGNLATDTQLAIDGGTLNSLGVADNIAGDVGVYNSGVINVGPGSGVTLTHTSGSMTIGALDPLSSPTGGTLNLYTSSALNIPSASSSTFIVFGEINMYGAAISMVTSRVSQLELDGGTLNTYGAATVPTTGDFVNGNLLNNGLVQYLGSVLHTLTIGSFFGGGNYTQGSGGTLNMRLGNSSTNDVLMVGGAASLNGMLDLDGSSLANNQSWTIIFTGSGISGNFSTPLWPDSDPDWKRDVGVGINNYGVTNL